MTMLETTTLSTTIYCHKKRSRPSRWMVSAGVMLVSIGAVPAAMHAAPNDVSRSEPARSVRVTTVEKRPSDFGLSATGTLSPRQLFAATSDMSGVVVKSVLANEGAFVQKGQVLAILDDTLIRAQIAQQAAVIAQQQAVVREAEAEAARARPIAGVGVLSIEAVQTRRFKADNARATLRVQQAQMHDFEARAAKFVVRAPVTGRIIDRNVRVGDISGPSQPMFTVVPTGTIDLQVQVPEARLAQLPIGTPALVTLADGGTINGAVSTLATRIDLQSAQGNVRVRLIPVAGQALPELRPGESGVARFEGTSGTASAVPEAAIQYDTRGAGVLVLGEGNRVHRVAVRSGGHSGGYVTLLEGPPPGTTILAASASFVTEGDRVVPVPATR